MNLNKEKTILLSNIKGCFCTAPSFYNKSNRKILKEDIKSNGIYKNLLVLDFKKENLAYRYYISDGNHRLRILKDLAMEQGKKLEEETILVGISEDEEEYNKVLQHVKNGDFEY